MQKLSEDIIIVLGASVFLLLITLFIVLLLMAYKKRDRAHVMERKKLKEEFNHQLLQSQIEVQEQTFQLIGKELHDNVGQLLSTSRMLIGLAERSLSSPPDTLLTANATLGEAINELRSLSKALDKEWLEQFNLIENLKTEVARVNTANSINTVLKISETPGLPSAAKQIILFRIIQEAIQNAIKHGNCKNIVIHISVQSGTLFITVQDDGQGFEITKSTNGMGLANMRHRTRLLDGTINYASSLKGTTVTIMIPETPTSNEN